MFICDCRLVGGRFWCFKDRKFGIEVVFWIFYFMGYGNIDDLFDLFFIWKNKFLVFFEKSEYLLMVGLYGNNRLEFLYLVCVF